VYVISEAMERRTGKLPHAMERRTGKLPDAMERRTGKLPDVRGVDSCQNFRD
jgi:hypothetical protein